jgi:hypothetical protein
MTQRVLGPSGSPRRRRLLLLLLPAFVLAAVFWVTASSADNPSGCDFAATGTTESCVGPLSGSTFAGGDGNLLTSPTTFGTTDWQNVAGLNTGVDLQSGGGDNAFGQGTKEDDANVSVVTGSIPPQKSDLTRFYEASEFANGDNFLYLAWERTNSLGSANMDFEINQKTQPDLTTAGKKTLNRTVGDLLVTFDFTNGGGRPTLGLLFWVTSGSTSQCFSSNSLPCWGNHVTLNGDNSEGAVNNLDAVTDPFLPGTNNIDTNRFGEAAINLTDAGVFPPGTCEGFGSAFLKSRSSASFPAEVKDFVAPVPVNISNCGRITIIKNTDPRGVNQNFSYTSTIPTPSGTPPPPTTPDCELNTTPTTFDPTPSSFTLNDATANTEDCTNVPAGSYTVTEAAVAGWTLESLNCTPGGSQDTTNLFQANITINPGDHVTCTYVNKQLVASSSTAQDWLPNDTATITGNADLNGTLTFQLYTGDNCGKTSGEAVSGQFYSFPISNVGSSATVSTTNGSDPTNTFKVTAANAGSYSWLVKYDDQSLADPTDKCEVSTVSITN